MNAESSPVTEEQIADAAEIAKKPKARTKPNGRRAEYGRGPGRLLVLGARYSAHNYAIEVQRKRSTQRG